jgi:hypothetical protein
MTLSGRVVCCSRGYDAQTAGEFIYLPHARAFVFTTPDAPKRELTWRARYYRKASEPDLTDEPVRYTCCAWCGADLPGTDDPKYPPTGNGEGPEA